MSITTLILALIGAGFLTKYVFGIIRYDHKQPLEAIEHFFIWAIMFFSTLLCYALITALRAVDWAI